MSSSSPEQFEVAEAVVSPESGEAGQQLGRELLLRLLGPHTRPEKKTLLQNVQKKSKIITV